MKSRHRRVLPRAPVVHRIAAACLLLALAANAQARSVEYDKMDQPIRIVDAMGQVTTITRDLISRPTSLTFADGKTTTLRYDLTKLSRGRLSEFVDRSGTTLYTYDIFGRVIAKRQTLASGFDQMLRHAYSAKTGLPLSITYPNGSVLVYIHDATGRLIQLNWNGKALISGIKWNPMGQPTAWRWAFVTPALYASRNYDTAARLTATEFSGYIYDAAGRITSLSQQLAQPADADPAQSTIASANVRWTVGYDPVGRITSFSTNGNAAEFRYDANGNRTSSSQTLNGRTTSRSYEVDSGSNRLMGFSQTMGSATTKVSYGYNANGDMTSDGLRRLTYDAEERLSAVTTGATDTSPTTRYAHNALGERVFKTEALFPAAEGDEGDPGFMQGLIGYFSKLWTPSAADAEKLGFAFMYDEEGTLLSETGTGGANSTGSTQHIYLPTRDGPMPIATVINGAIYAVHSDHLNTPRRLTDSQRQMVWQWPYSAFGEDMPTHARNRFANLEATPNPGKTNISEVVYNLRYPGQYFDKESGLFYNGFRTYCSTCGRYTQADPIGLDGGWNRFSYVDSNPLNFIDPLGLMKIYDDGSVTMHAYPGQQAGGREHARYGPGGSYHLHLKDTEGREARISTETWKPLTPEDQRIYDRSKDMRNACQNLSDGEKKFFDRVNRQIFHRGAPTANQLLRIGNIRGGMRASGTSGKGPE